MLGAWYFSYCGFVFVNFIFYLFFFSVSFHFCFLLDPLPSMLFFTFSLFFYKKIEKIEKKWWLYQDIYDKEEELPPKNV